MTTWNCKDCDAEFRTMSDVEHHDCPIKQRYSFVVVTGRYKILDLHKTDRQQIATADNEEAAQLIVRALNHQTA